MTKLEKKIEESKSEVSYELRQVKKRADEFEIFAIKQGISKSSMYPYSTLLDKIEEVKEWFDYLTTNVKNAMDNK